MGEITEYPGMGPGRGSGAGSLVAYALKITDVDPLKYGLLFERFLNVVYSLYLILILIFVWNIAIESLNMLLNAMAKHLFLRLLHLVQWQLVLLFEMLDEVLGYPYGMVDAVAKLIPLKWG